MTSTRAGPLNVVIDGRMLSWKELGLALEPYDRWTFCLDVEDRVQGVRTDADVIGLRSRPGSPDR